MRTVLRLLIPGLLVFTATAAPVSGKTYSAERFDVHVRVLPGGDLEVTETVVFRFESGTFSHVFREIRTRRTDGIEILRAEMDGRDVPFGEGEGRVEISGRERIRVRWNFAPVSQSTHTFVVRYVARGVVQKVQGADLLAWRALPSEHDYRIDSSTVNFEYPAMPLEGMRLAPRRVSDLAVEQGTTTVRVVASGIARNGWIEGSVRFPDGSLIATPPAWQQRRITADALGPRWLTAAGIVLGAGIVMIVAMRQRYDAPPRDAGSGAPEAMAPDTLSPALAGAITSNGSVTLPHAMATLFALAERGEINIAEEPRGRFGQRSYTLRRISTGRPLAPEEEAALRLAFNDKGHDEVTVSLSKARSRLTRHFREFRNAVHGQLAAHGLLDAERQRLRNRYRAISVGLLLVGSAALIVCALLVRWYGAWPLAVPGAIFVVAILGLIVAASLTPLSNEGVRRAARWRGFEKHLRDVARDRAHSAASAATILPFAVTLGLAAAWSKYLKQHPGGVPPWFQALSTADDGGFPAFIAAGGATSSGGGAGAGGGAAGGGASGAG